MSIRGITLVGGVLWGLLLALLCGFLTIAITASVLWLFLFGDGPWPQSSQSVLLAAAAAVAVLSFCTAVYLSVLLARRLERWPVQGKARKAALVFASSAALALLFVAATQFLADRHNQQARLESNQQEEEFLKLTSSLHRVLKMEQTFPAEKTTRLMIVTEGLREGGYRFGWSVVDRLYKKTLLQGESELHLGRNTGQLEVPLDLERLAKTYQKEILTGPPGNVLVDQSFEFLAWLEPVLTEQERNSIPQRELQNLSIGTSAMRLPYEGKVAVRFKALADGTLVF